VVKEEGREGRVWGQRWWVLREEHVWDLQGRVGGGIGPVAIFPVEWRAAGSLRSIGEVRDARHVAVPVEGAESRRRAFGLGGRGPSRRAAACRGDSRGTECAGGGMGKASVLWGSGLLAPGALVDKRR
jgi:hypothetical protein